MAYEGYHKLKALVVDDFDSFRMTINKMLNEFGIDGVDNALNGLQAIQFCRKKSFDLILCDYNLGGGKNGQQVLEELRVTKLLKHTNLFLLISAETGRSMVMATYDYEPDGYLAKPITGKSLKQRLDRLLLQREELMAIYQAMDEGDPYAAIDLCRGFIERGSRYSSICQKLLGNLLLQIHDYKSAGELYQSVLRVRPLEWARVGLAKVKQAEGDFSTSDQWLRELINSNPLCMQAYDALADSCQKQGDSEQLQSVLQQAVNISPMSIVRQRTLAETADANNDVTVAASAYRQAVKLGQHSCHDNVETYLRFGRATAKLFNEDQHLAQELSRDALRALSSTHERFNTSPEQEAQVQLIECQVHAGQGNKSAAEEVLKAIQSKFHRDEPSLDIDTELDHVQALTMLGHDQQAKQMLDILIERHREDERALEKIDQLLEEPLSEHNRQHIAKVNRSGIALYEAKKYKEAIDCFSQVKRMFPNHIGVHLNLAQTLLGEMEEYGREQGLMELCLKTLSKVERKIKSGHVQYRRFMQLKERIRQLGKSAGGEG